MQGFPNKLGSPQLTVETDTLVDDGAVPGAIATVKSIVAADESGAHWSATNLLLQIIPHVDGAARICELVR